MKNTFALHTRHAHTQKKHFEKHAAEVESRTQGSRPRPRTQKKSEAKANDSLFEDRPSRGQGQECWRPRTKDTAATVLQKKDLQKSFSGNLQFIGMARIFDWKGCPNHKSHAMTSSKFSKEELFVGQRYHWMEDLKSLPVGI